MEIFWLYSLGIRALILAHNNIKTIDEKFNNYKDLYRLDLSNNRINELSGTSFLEMQSLRYFEINSIFSKPIAKAPRNFLKLFYQKPNFYILIWNYKQ